MCEQMLATQCPHAEGSISAIKEQYVTSCANKIMQPLDLFLDLGRDELASVLLGETLERILHRIKIKDIGARSDPADNLKMLILSLHKIADKKSKLLSGKVVMFCIIAS